MTINSLRTPSVFDALIPLTFLGVLLALSVYYFGDSSSSGANQIALILAACVAGLVGIKNGHKWEAIESGMIRGISLSFSAVLILFAVGALIGTWILSGTVPTLIYLGLKILTPSIFYAASCLLCAAVALSIGSSWTVAGTLGIGLMGIASGLQMDPAITAGAIISGAYFGDKMSPLSETTNMASAVGGSELFQHIRHMTYTTFPSFGIALLIFAFLGYDAQETATPESISLVLMTLENKFQIAWYLLLPVVLLLALAARKVPAFPSILIGSLSGALFAIIFQPDIIHEYVGDTTGLGNAEVMLKGIWITLYDGYSANTGNEVIDSLLSRGGMANVLTTVWLIICAMAFGGVLESTGLLKALITPIVSNIKRVGSLITATLLTCIGVNVAAADQYVGIILPGRMFKNAFDQRGLAPVNLSRALEDAGTVTSALIPWNTCGAYMSATLGIATWSYAPYAFFNLIMPIMAIIFAYTGVKILYVEKKSVAVEPQSQPQMVNNVV
jgi:NhaC family Na+:H+ antiporter